MIQEFEHGMVTFRPEPPLVIEPGSFTGDAQELARVIAKQVENYPESFDMSAWVTTTSDVAFYIDEDGTGVTPVMAAERTALLRAQDGTQCGTTLCIAGYAQLFVDGYITNNVDERAAELLGLDKYTALFYVGNNAARRILGELADGTYKPNN